MDTRADADRLGSARPEEDRVDFEVLDAVAGLFARFLAEAEDTARAFGIPTFVLKALHLIDAPLAMKELGSRMRCDPSFITSIADTLERHGLAARESHPGDRRVKRLVLTPAGVELRDRVERQLAARMPWRAALSPSERETLLALVRKMSPPRSAAPSAPVVPRPAAPGAPAPAAPVAPAAAGVPGAPAPAARAAAHGS